MARSNDGCGYQSGFYPPFPGQDRKYFPLGTSKAKPAAGPHWLKNPKRFQKALAEMLGSEKAAERYVLLSDFLNVEDGRKR